MSTSFGRSGSTGRFGRAARASVTRTRGTGAGSTFGASETARSRRCHSARTAGLAPDSAFLRGLGSRFRARLERLVDFPHPALEKVRILELVPRKRLVVGIVARGLLLGLRKLRLDARAFRAEREDERIRAGSRRRRSRLRSDARMRREKIEELGLGLCAGIGLLSGRRIEHLCGALCGLLRELVHDALRSFGARRRRRKREAPAILALDGERARDTSTRLRDAVGRNGPLFARETPDDGRVERGAAQALGGVRRFRQLHGARSGHGFHRDDGAGAVRRGGAERVRHETAEYQGENQRAVANGCWWPADAPPDRSRARAARGGDGRSAWEAWILLASAPGSAPLTEQQSREVESVRGVAGGQAARVARNSVDPFHPAHAHPVGRARLFPREKVDGAPDAERDCGVELATGFARTRALVSGTRGRRAADPVGRGSPVRRRCGSVPRRARSRAAGCRCRRCARAGSRVR